MVIHLKPHNLKVLLLYPVICLPTKHLTRLNVPLHSRLNGNLEVLVFLGEGKTGEPEKILWEKGREPKTNPTLIWC